MVVGKNNNMKDFISDEEMMALEQTGQVQSPVISDSQMQEMETASIKPSTLKDRLRASFGDKTTQANIVEGQNGGVKEFVGDVADIAGKSLPFIGGAIGGAGGTFAGAGVGAIPGAAIGATAGESLRQGVGNLLGARQNTTRLDEVKDLATTGAGTLIGGKVGGYIISRLPKLLGIFSAEGDDAIRAALSNPKAADLGIKNGDDALRTIVTEGSRNSVKLKNDFVTAYNTAFDKLTESAPGKLVSRQKILYQFVDDLKAQGVKAKNGVLDFTTSKIQANPGEISKINNAYSAIQKWDDWSLRGTNELKQLVGAFTRFADEAGIPSKSPFLGKFYRYIDNTIKSSLPTKASMEYGAMNKKFSDNIELFDDMVDAFNKGDPFTRLAGVFGNNKDSLRQIIDFYDSQTGAGAKAVVAGRVLAQEKSAAFGFLNPRSWIDFFLSPSLQGKAITSIGKVSNPILDIARKGYPKYQSFVKDSIEDPMNAIFNNLKR